MFTIDQKDLPDRLKSYTMLDGTPIPNYIVVDIINAAIQAGVVSPPCYVIRKPDGCGLLNPWSAYTSRESASDSAPYRHKVEHWKGQTQ